MVNIVQQPTQKADHHAPSIPHHLAEAGYILKPNHDRVAAFKIAGLHLTRGSPTLVGRIPNPQEFSTGSDISGSMYIVKPEGSDNCLFPARDRPFLATLQEMIDREYALSNARQLVFAIRPSRHTAAAGQPHQRHIPHWHDHQSFGQHRIQIASDVLGTQFKNAGQETTAPNGSVMLFDESTLHRTPIAITETRRTFLAFMALEPRIAYRLLRDQANINPAEHLLNQQPYKSYDDPALRQHWRQRGKIALDGIALS